MNTYRYCEVGASDSRREKPEFCEGGERDEVPVSDLRR
jgi:hypothetical protein